MHPIKNNPFRILGLPGNSSEKELQKQIAIFKRYSEVGKANSSEYDFPFFGNVERTAENIL